MRMAIQRIDLRFRNAAGMPHILALNPDLIACDMAGITLSARTEPIEGGKTVQAAISNRSGTEVRLDSIHYYLTLDFSPARPPDFSNTDTSRGAGRGRFPWVPRFVRAQHRTHLL
jgi:hypothetical protein